MDTRLVIKTVEKSLIPVRRMITRGGKSFMTTVYIASTVKEKKEQTKKTALIIAPTEKRDASRSTVEFMKMAGDVIDFAPDEKLAVDKVLKFQSEYFKGKDEASIYDAVQVATEEVQHAMGLDSDSGKEWYKESMDRTRNILVAHYQNLAGDTEWDFFLGILSVLSPGVKPMQNLAMAVSVYDGYSKTGSIGIKNPVTGKAYSVQSSANLTRFSNILSKFSDKSSFVQYMNGISSTGEVNKFGGSIQGWKDESAYNSMIFGEKVGMFYQSMRGTYGAVAVDRWAIRSFYRWMGKLRADPTGKVLDDTVDSHDRKNIEYVMQIVGEKLGLSPSETQAVMWYYEKRLYKKLGFPEKYFGTEDYADAAEKIFLNKSLDVSLLNQMMRSGKFPTFDKFLSAIMGIKKDRV